MRSINTALQSAEKQLHERGIPEDDALILLSDVLKKNKAYLLSHREIIIDSTTHKLFMEGISKRADGYSVASITGHKYFYGLDFLVTNDTLIPRPETELLVDRAKKSLEAYRKPTIIDIGTGCGCIIISLAHAARSERVHLFASDISLRALGVAKKNAQRYDTSISFHHSNLFSHIPNITYDIVIANLPYVPTIDLREPSIQREPRGALWGGTDGFSLYRDFLKQVKKYTRPGSRILFEIHPLQADTARLFIKEYIMPHHTLIHQDLSHKDRVVEIVR